MLLIIVGAIVALALIIGFIQDRREKDRIRQLEREAATLGLAFSEEGDPQIYNQAPPFLLFLQGESGRMQNLMRGQWPAPGDVPDAATVEVALFEHIFTTPYGRYARLWRQTVLHIRDDALDLPSFVVMKEAFFNMMVKNARDKELRERLTEMINLRFKDHPAFNDMMHVVGPDRTAIRPLFSDALIAHLRQAEMLSIEGSGRDLLIYRYDELLAPRDLDEFLTEARTAYAHIRASAAAGRQPHPPEKGERE